MNESKRSYSPDEVQTLVVNEEIADKLYVIYRTIDETQFYSPGVKINRDEKNNVYIEVIRVGIHDKIPPIDIKAEYLVKWVKVNNLPVSIKDKTQFKSTSADQIFILPGQVGSIYITDGKNKAKVWPK